MPREVTTVKTVTTTVILSLAILAGCGGADEVRTGPEPAAPPAEPVPGESPAAPVGDQLRAFAYDLESGDTVVAAFGTAGDSVTLYLPGEALRLPHVPAASGAKYAGEGIVFWNKGDEVMIETPEGTTLQGNLNPRQSTLETSRLKGNEFYATGNEPGWKLEIGPTETVLVTDYGNWRFQFPTPVPETDSVLGRTFYEAHQDGVDIVIELRNQTCHDSMNGWEYPTTVLIRLGSRELRGCGTPLD